MAHFTKPFQKEKTPAGSPGLGGSLLPPSLSLPTCLCLKTEQRLAFHIPPWMESHEKACILSPSTCFLPWLLQANLHTKAELLIFGLEA